MKVLVVSATGILGKEVCRRLLEKGHQVRGLVRTGSAKEGDVRGLGVEIAHGDLLDRGSLDAACKGVDAVVCSATAILSKGKGNTIAAVDDQGVVALVEA